VCREVCIPEQQVVQGVLPGRGSAQLAAVPPGLAQRLAVGAGPVPARRVSPTLLCLERVPVALPEAPIELIADAGRELDAALPVGVSSRPGRGPARVTLPAAGQLRAAGDTVLLVAGAVGVTVPLDFQAPAPRCMPR
jgi:hypothetical protein